MSDSSIWIEKFRPKKFEDVIGQDKIVGRIKAFVEQKNLPHLLFSGPAGVGKTSLILTAARELYGENFRQNILETNASDSRGIDTIRNEVKDFARTKSIGNVPFKICILDEADALTREAQQALRRTMEQYSSICRFCLITNWSSKIIINRIISKLAKEENLKIDDGAREALIYVSSGDVRRLENVLQSCSMMSHEISEELIYEIVSAAKPKEIWEILDSAVKGNFVHAKNKLLDVMLKHGLSGLDIIKQIQSEIWNLDLSDERKIELVDKCGEIEFRMIEGSDEFIQMESLIANFMKK